MAVSDNLAREIGLDERQLGPITLSVGIAVFPEDGATTKAVLQAADRALISSKEACRNAVTMGEAISSGTLPRGR